jgi:hypothetical protein
MHQKVHYPLPESNRIDRKLQFLLFPFELALWLAPWACGFLLIFGERLNTALALIHLHLPRIAGTWIVGGWLMTMLGTTWMLRIAYRYRGEFKLSPIDSLIADTEVSQMRPRAVELRGEIVGNGVPGAFWSPDFVMRDESGMIFLLYRSSIPFARLFFALTNADRFIGEQVVLQGWYRRGLRPYVEISKLSADVVGSDAGPGLISVLGASSSNAVRTPEKLVQRSYSRWIQSTLAAAATAVGIIWLLRG